MHKFMKSQMKINRENTFGAPIATGQLSKWTEIHEFWNGIGRMRDECPMNVVAHAISPTRCGRAAKDYMKLSSALAC